MLHTPLDEHRATQRSTKRNTGPWDEQLTVARWQAQGSASDLTCNLAAPAPVSGDPCFSQ